MSLRSKNLKAIKERYPSLYNRIADLKPSGRYKLIQTPGKQNAINLVDTKDNQIFYDRHDPIGAVIKDIKKRDIKVPNFNIFLGSALFYNQYAFYKVHNYENHTNIIIEKDIDLFVTSLDFVDITEIVKNPTFHLVIDEGYTSVFTFINSALHKSNAKLFVKAINFIEDYKSYINNKEYYLSCVKAAKEAISEVLIFFGNDPLDSLIGINHTFINIREIIDYPGVMDIKGLFKGKPGVVIATGPSLMKNIHLLEGIKDKAVFCSVDASVKVLQKHNLKPHMVTCLERVIETSRLFEGLKEEEVEDVFLAGTPVIHPMTYRNWPGERFVVYRNFATFQWLDIEKGMLEIGPSSGNMAFKLLEYLGCDPIILVGQDLAYGDKDLTHAEGTTYGTKQTGVAFQNQLEVPGNYKSTVKTTKVWNSFLNYYHKDVSESPAKVINATEGGAKIMGTEIISLQEAIDKYIKEPFDVTGPIRENLKYPTDENIKELDVKTLSIVDAGLAFCLETQDKFKSGLETCNHFAATVYKDYNETGNYDEVEGNKLLDQVNGVMQVVNTQEFYTILMHYVQSYLIRTGIEINAVKAKAKTVAEEHVGIAALSKDFFGVMIGLNEKMIKLLEDLKKSLSESVE